MLYLSTRCTRMQHYVRERIFGTNQSLSPWNIRGKQMVNKMFAFILIAILSPKWSVTIKFPDQNICFSHVFMLWVSQTPFISATSHCTGPKLLTFENTRRR